MVSKDIFPETLFGAEISEQSSSRACVLDLNIGLSGFFGPASLSGAGVAGRVGWGFGTAPCGHALGPAGEGMAARGPAQI